jgi:hypothetical protein
MEPHDLHPDLSWDRLDFLANVIVRVRHETALMHQPKKGDNLWSLGCRSFARTCFAFAQAALVDREPDWLGVLNSESHFVILVGGVPVRFYSGDPENPPSRALRRHNPELEAAQYALGLVTTNKSRLGIVRLIVERGKNNEVGGITLVNLDSEGNILNAWAIPLPPIDGRLTKTTPPPTGPDVIPLNPTEKGIDVPPAAVRPLRREEEERDEKR